ncbi:MAG TPA: DNA/RNA nuclease SfsA [Gammaproteobacteria bacterium]|nr:DNA/RNA nuclease SfsA [Gammaproteobacteria bacterium]
MDFAEPLLAGVLRRRRQRFLAEVQLADGGIVTAHCPNTGSMLGCCEPGFRVWPGPATRPGRRCPCTWELVSVPESGGDGETLVGINTGRANAPVHEALQRRRIPGLDAYPAIRREVPVDNGRIDFPLQSADGARCFVEVKNVTAAVSGGRAPFPDAVSSRACRHLRELARLAAEGHRSVLRYVVQRRDVECVAPAAEIDPDYAGTLARVRRDGVEVLAWRGRGTPRGIRGGGGVTGSLQRSRAATRRHSTSGPASMV